MAGALGMIVVTECDCGRDMRMVWQYALGCAPVLFEWRDDGLPRVIGKCEGLVTRDGYASHYVIVSGQEVVWTSTMRGNPQYLMAGHTFDMTGDREKESYHG